jgi:hypothetical protein
MRGPFRLRTVIPAALAALVLPASAAAHGRTATIALDYRLALDRSTRDLPGVHVRILDGDRVLRVGVDRGTVLVVRGELGEGMLRVDASGVWANAGSPTATGDRVVPAGGQVWVRLSGGRTVVWHDHRLAPPPATTVGAVGRFVVPVVVDGVPAAISGTFFRVARPPVWPWPLAALLLVGAIVVASRRRRGLRGPLTVALGASAGIAALVEVTTFAVGDAPTGGVAWLQVITAFVVVAVLGALLVRLRGRSRVHAAGVVGAVAAAVSLGSTPVFWHGVVISALPALGARAVCELAIVAGVAAACLSLLRDFDGPARVARPAPKVGRPLPR